MACISQCCQNLFTKIQDVRLRYPNIPAPKNPKSWHLGSKVLLGSGVRDSYRNFGLGGGGGREIKCMLGGGGGGVLCDIPPSKKKAYLIRIAIEGPDLSADEALDILNKRTGESDCRLCIYSYVRIILTS